MGKTTRQGWRAAAVWMAVVAALLSLTACASINERQLMADSVVSEADRLVKSITDKRSEFDQLVAEYRLSMEPAYLARMEALIDLVGEDIELARQFHALQRYYPRGLSFHRWEETKRALELGEKSRCEMLLATGELQMLFADDHKAQELFRKLLEILEEEGLEAGYRQQVRNRLLELRRENRLAANRAGGECGE